MTGRKGAAPIPTERQVSSGGVVFRRRGDAIDVALVLVGEKRRWQLPKGIVDPGESPETTAVREAREEAGVETAIVAPLETIEYWYVGHDRARGAKVRYHKFVHCFLLEYERGDVREHDDEVLESRWVPIDEAAAMLAFPSERKVMEEARGLLRGG